MYYYTKYLLKSNKICVVHAIARTTAMATNNNMTEDEEAVLRWKKKKKMKRTEEINKSEEGSVYLTCNM